MPNELRIQNGLFLDNFTNNASAPNFLLIDGNGLVSYFPTGSLTIPTAATSSYPIATNSNQKSLYSVAPVAGFPDTISRVIWFGDSAGSLANGAEGTIFLGSGSGANATNARESIFLGTEAGKAASATSHSILIGYSAGRRLSGSIGPNNIVIGTNITLPSASANAINIGGVIFATGSYGTATGAPFSGSQDPTVGRVGIGTNNPTSTLHVSGTVTITGTSASFVAPAPPNVQVTTGSGATSGWRGLGTNGKITPTKSGRVFAMVSGYYQGAVASTSTIKLLTSSSATAPTAGTTNASIPTGSATQIGAGIQVKSFTTDGTSVPFSLQGLVTLTTGTTYWFDTFTEVQGVLSASLTVFEI